MQISTTRDALAVPLALVAGAADSRNQVPMLGDVLIRASKNQISLICSDSTIAARSITECAVTKEGEFSVDVRRLGDLITALPTEQQVDLSLDDSGTLLVKCGRSRFRLPTHPAADYPRMSPGKEDRIAITIGGKRLSEMLDQVSDAMASNETRAYLNGALVSLAQGFLTVVGTDGHRMVVAREPIAGSEEIAGRSIILPRKTVLLCRKLLNQSENVRLTLGSSDVQFSLDNGTVVFAKSIDGTYPAWDRVIPSTDREAVFESVRLMEAMALMNATTVADEKGKPRAVSLEFSAATMVISSSDEKSRCEVDMTTDKPAEHVLGFNLDYLRSAIHTVSAAAGKVRLCTAEGKQVMTLKPADSDYPLAVVMALRL